MRKTAFLIAILSFGTSVFAQTEENFNFGGTGSHEFSIGGGIGHSTLIYGDMPFLFTFGGGLNFGYAFNISENFAFFTGLEINFYNAETASNRFMDTLLIKKSDYDFGGFDPMDFYYFVDAQGIREKQTVAYLYIPIMARYRIPVGLNFLYLMGGAKLGIPILGSYTGSMDKITTTGFNELSQGDWLEKPEYGFDDYLNNPLDGKLDLKLSVVLSFEFGYEHVLNSGKGIQFGAYINYGITNIMGNQNTRPVDYNPHGIGQGIPVSPKLNSFTNRFDSMNTLGLGLMLRFRF
jgi:hypothetical protein